MRANDLEISKEHHPLSGCWFKANVNIYTIPYSQSDPDLSLTLSVPFPYCLPPYVLSTRCSALQISFDTESLPSQSIR